MGGEFTLRQTPNLPFSQNSEGWSRRLPGLFKSSKLRFRHLADESNSPCCMGRLRAAREHAGSDIDLMIVGTLQQIDLLRILQKLESRFHREVNVTLFSPEVPSEISIGRPLPQLCDERQDNSAEGFTE